MKLFNQTMKSHGQGPLYALFLSFDGSAWGNPGIRVSLGGYGWTVREWWRPYITRYPLTATHVGIGPLSVSWVGSTRFTRWIDLQLHKLAVRRGKA